MSDLVFVLVGVIGGFVAGLGGPGGLPVIGWFYSQASMSTAEVAGTSSSIFVFATIFASSMYYYSGDVNWKVVVPLVPTTLLGTTLGAWLNLFLSREVFGAAIAVIVTIIGLNVAYREIKELQPYVNLDYTTTKGKVAISGLGLIVGVVGGALGVGGPALSIPVLIFLGVPALEAIGAGLVQGIIVTSSTAVNYALSGDVVSEMILVVGLPYVLSEIAGFYVAQNTDVRKLKIALGLMLALLGPYILLLL